MKGSLGGSTGEKAAGACYAYPLLGGMDFPGMRIGGPGLGNLLLPWARCQVAAERHGWTRIAPTWPQVKAGPILRGETDWRTYVGLFRTAPGEVAGLRKFLLLRGGRRVAESAAGDGRVPEGGRVVVFEGLEGGFGPLLGKEALVRKRLLGVVRERHLRGWRTVPRRSVALHVRLGDFVEASAEGPAKGAWNTRTSMDWYVGVLRRIQEAVPADWPVLLYSDGRDGELAPLLAMPRVARAGFGSSIADILGLARSGILVASGSTFSMWGSYLGSGATIWPEGQMRWRFRAGGPDSEAEVDDPAELEASWVRRAVDAVTIEFNKGATSRDLPTGHGSKHG